MSTIQICDKPHPGTVDQPIAMIPAAYTVSRHDNAPNYKKDLCTACAQEFTNSFFQAGINTPGICITPIKNATTTR